MSEEKAEEEKAAAVAPKKGSSLPLIIGGLVVILAGGGGAYYFLRPAAAPPAAAHAAAGDEDDDKKENPAAEETLVTLAPFVVNISDSSAESDEVHFLKCTIAVALKTGVAQEKLDHVLPKIRHLILLFLSDLSIKQVVGTENKLQIAKSLLGQITNVLGKHSITNVYLTEFIVQ